jgi:hypothetical protein
VKIGKKNVQVFKIKNRTGYAALCGGHLTEGKNPNEAVARMVKALKRTARLGARKR